MSFEDGAAGSSDTTKSSTFYTPHSLLEAQAEVIVEHVISMQLVISYFIYMIVDREPVTFYLL